MEEPQSTPSRRDWLLPLLLAVLALGLRVWQVSTAEVPARDCIGYIHIAWQLEHGDWREVIRKGPQHPGYPLAILATSWLMRHVDRGSLPDVMAHSAQLVSSIASVLLVVPMFYLGRELFDRRVGFWATLLFQLLPASGRVLADGLSEALFFLFAATALWLVAVAFNRRSAWCFAGVGFFGALAFVIRPEGALIVVAAGVVLTALQVRRVTRQSWRHYVGATACLCLAALVLVGPFVFVTGRLTTKYTAEVLMHVGWLRGVLPVTETRPTVELATQPALFAVYWGGEIGQESERSGWALMTLLDVLCKSFFYVLWLPALLALWLRRDGFLRSGGSWVMALVSAALLVLMYSVAVRMGYLSERHALLILFCGVYWVAAGLLLLGEWFAARLPAKWWNRPGLLAGALAALVCVAGLLRTLEPMHGDRSGFREAGYWLAANAKPEETIDDPYTWAKYYAGRYFVEPPPHVKGTGHHVYVVVEMSSNKHPRLKPESNMKFVFEQGHLIKSWPVRRSREQATIDLYEVTY